MLILNLGSIFTYQIFSCQTRRITMSACQWHNTSAFNATLMVRFALKDHSAASWCIMNHLHTNM